MPDPVFSSPPVKPLLLSAYTATTCLGVGHRCPPRRPCATDRSGLQPLRLRDREPADLGGRNATVGRRAGRCPPRCPPTTAATTAWPCWRCAPMASRTRVRTAVARAWGAPGGCLHGHQHLRHPGNRTRLPPARPRQRRAAGRVPLRAPRTTRMRSAEFLREHLGITGMAAHPFPPRVRPAPRCSPPPHGRSSWARSTRPWSAAWTRCA